MTLRRALTAGLFGLLVAAVSPVASASAAPGDYPTDGDSALSVSATAVDVGTTITVTGNGFPPGTVTITSAVVAQGFARSAPAAESLGSFRGAGSASGVQRLAAAACSTGVTCSTIADPAGSFSIQFTLTRAGTTVITASGGGVVKSQTVQVGSGSAVGGSDNRGDGTGVGGLPNTGSNLKTPLLLGGVLILLGGGATVLSRRRKRDAPVPS